MFKKITAIITVACILFSLLSITFTSNAVYHDVQGLMGDANGNAIVEYCYFTGLRGYEDYTGKHYYHSSYTNECYDWSTNDGSLYKDTVANWNEEQGINIWKIDTENVNGGYPI